jgi:hypothetical protein
VSADPSRPRNLLAIREELVDCAAKVRMLDWELRCLSQDDLRLVWVSPEMCELLVEVAESVPDDVVLNEVPRSLRGLVVFARPIECRDAADPAMQTLVNGQLYGPVWIGTGRELGVSIASVCYMSEKEMVDHAVENGVDVPQDLLNRDHDRTSHWWLAGRAEWMEDEQLSEVKGSRLETRFKAVGDFEAYVESAVEDRRLLVALLTLMRQERHVEVGTWEPHSRSAKRRLGAVEVTVVALRRPESESGDESKVGAKLKHRTWVAPYFRMQPFGPGRAQRRIQLIDGHMRGPDDAPVRTRKRVWTLKR